MTRYVNTDKKQFYNSYLPPTASQDSVIPPRVFDLSAACMSRVYDVPGLEPNLQ
jgi:hypothetical protein